MSETEDPRKIREREHLNSALRNMREKREATERVHRFLVAWKTLNTGPIATVRPGVQLTVADLEALIS